MSIRIRGLSTGWLLVTLVSLMFFIGSPGARQRGSGRIPELQMARMVQIQGRHEADIMKVPGVLGIGIGIKDEEPAFVVLVDKSAPRPVVPPQLEGIPVATRLTDKIVAHNGGSSCAPCHSDQQSLPSPMGQSTSNVNPCYSGTLGFVACDQQMKLRGYVTNNHVAAAVSGTLCENGSPGLQQLERSIQDNGCSSSGLFPIGALNKLVTLVSMDNLVDAAFVQSGIIQTSSTIRDVGTPSTNPGTVAVGDCVKKSGRTTGLTFAKVILVNATIAVGGYCGGTLTFKDQIVSQADGTCGIGPISNPGDSGAALLNVNNQIVGLLFGGSGTGASNLGYANTIQNVLSQLGLTLDLTQCEVVSCPASTALAGTAGAQTTLDALYSLRDRVLARTAQGQRYIQLYNENSTEATLLLLRNYRLLLQARELLNRFTPVVQSMTASAPVTVTQGDVQAADQFLQSMSGLWISEKMKSAIEQVRRDLRSSAVQAQFNVNVSR